MMMTSIGTPFRLEGPYARLNRQPTLLKHAPKNGVVLQPEIIFLEFKGNMAIAEVIGSLE